MITGSTGHSLLVPGRTILLCDHVNSSSSFAHGAAHFMTVEEHLSTFKKVGFITAGEVAPPRSFSYERNDRSAKAALPLTSSRVTGVRICPRRKHF
jgi:hypothetical protein